MMLRGTESSQIKGRARRKREEADQPRKLRKAAGEVGGGRGECVEEREHRKEAEESSGPFKLCQG